MKFTYDKACGVLPLYPRKSLLNKLRDYVECSQRLLLCFFLPWWSQVRFDHRCLKMGVAFNTLEQSLKCLFFSRRRYFLIVFRSKL